MIDPLAEYLAANRTLTEAEVHRRDRARARYDLTPAERLESITHRTMIEESRH